MDPEEVNRIEAQGSTTENSTKSGVGCNIIVNILLSGSLYLVWAMINGLQVVTHLPLYNVSSPGNVNAFLSYLEDMTRFDLIDTQSILERYYFLPELPTVNLKF